MCGARLANDPSADSLNRVVKKPQVAKDLGPL